MAQKRYSDSGCDQANKIIRRNESAFDIIDYQLGMQILIETVRAMNGNHSNVDGFAEVLSMVDSLSQPPPEPSMVLDPDVLNTHQVFEIPEDGLINQQIEPGTSDTGFINNQIEPQVPGSDLNDHQVLDGGSENLHVQHGGEGSDDPHHNSEMADMGLTPDDVERLVRDGGEFNGYTVVPRTRFNSLEILRNINLRAIASTDMASYVLFLDGVLNDIVSISRIFAGDGGIIHVLLSGESLMSDVNALLTPANDYSVSALSDQLENIMQSNRDVCVDDNLMLKVSIVRSKNGGARRKFRDLAHNEVIKRNRMNLFCPANMSDKLCFALCLAHFLNPQKTDPELVPIAASIQNAAGFSIQDMIRFNDVALFERLLNIKIVVFHRSSTGALEKYMTKNKPHYKTVFLYLSDSHYFMIKKLKAFIGSDYVCDYCYDGFSNKRDHRCKYACDICNAPDCYKHPVKTIHCGDCLRYCKSEYCYEMHKKPPLSQQFSQCDVTKYCPTCNRRYHISGDKPKAHKCTPEKCMHCGVELTPDGAHQCFIQPLRLETPSEKYIFYDFETRYEGGKHVANFVCAITFAGEEFTAEGTDCVAQLVQRFRHPRYTDYTWIAHNASGFDNFILLEYFTKVGLTLKITMQGCRLILMFDESFKQRFLDSFSFLPMRLAKTASAMNLTCAEKGYFPHHFNRVENENYIGPYPDKKMYGYDTMSEKEREQFDDWYKTVEGEVFDFKKELALYGKNDVVLLREACMKYRDEFIQCTALDPFRYTTLASCCMAVYKTHYLQRDTLALTHNGAYLTKNKAYSNASIEWLEYVSHSRGVDVQHALNRGEMSFGSYHLDGYYVNNGQNQNQNHIHNNNNERHALEFLGCMWHSHSCKFKEYDIHPVTKLTHAVHRRQHEAKMEVLEKGYGLNVEVMWECEWNAAKRTDPDVIAFMATYTHPERLKPRDALFGGRTNAYKLYHKAAEGEKIRYVDFTSLYPFCQAKKCYPIGHPQIILKDFEPLENYYGLIKASVLPPRKLLHPVLPYRANNKLNFPLCATCCEEQNQTTPCDHTDEKRMLSGCWVSLELLKAIEKGYVVTKVDEVWHFPQSSETLFCEYVKTFLQYKQEASGYPAHVVTEQDKQAYIADYFEKEGIQMNPDKISLNPARRSINKLLLNSLWGRFSMRENLPNTVLLSDPEEFTRYIFGMAYEIKHFSFVSDKVALVQWIHPDGKGARTRDINIFLGAFTTAHARLELYDLMDRLNERVLYSDTDSVIFTSKDGDWDPPLGPYLGNLTDEIGDDDFAVEFVSCGPKTYAYRTAKGRTVLKAKGIVQNYTNSQIITLDTLVDLVRDYVNEGDPDRHVLASADSIVRNKRHLTLHNKTVVKKFKLVYNKRVINKKELTTFPYGF
nr:uncharacterized protein LOC129450248 [Misgurnus anguillicaudatus]